MSTSTARKTQKVEVEPISKTDHIVGLLKELSVQELVVLEESLRKEFSLGALDLGAASGPAQAVETGEVKKKVSLVLEDIGDTPRTEVIKALTGALGIKVMDCLGILNNLPYVMAENITSEEAEEKKKKFAGYPGLVLVTQ